MKFNDFVLLIFNSICTVKGRLKIFDFILD